MKKLLMTVALIAALATPAHARSAHRRPHAMTAGEFRQVLRDRDVSWAKAWQAAQDEADREELAGARARLARAEQEGRRLEKIEKAYHEAQSVLEEKSRCAAFTAAQGKLMDEMNAVEAPASPEAQAFIRHAWAAHRLNHE